MLISGLLALRLTSPAQAEVTAGATHLEGADAEFLQRSSSKARDLISPAPNPVISSPPTQVEWVTAEAVSSEEADEAEQETTPSLDPNAGLRIPLNLGESLPIEQVFVYLRNPTSDLEQDEVFRQQVAEIFRIQAGASFSRLFADQALNEVQQLPFVQSAEYRLYESNRPGSLILALLVTLQPEPSEESAAIQPSGIVVSGRFQDFPTLYQSDRSLVKFILNGGIGGFSDIEPWFGNADNFVAGAYQPTDTITWGEAYLEPGVGGITQVGRAPVYFFGAGTYTLSTTIQPDIFRVDDRFFGDIEQLYGGLLFAEPKSSLRFNVSVGRQKFQLNQGFLFSQFAGSANALDRAASFSNPRTAYEQTILADLRWGHVRWQGFFLQPNELSVADSETQYLGTSLSFNNNRNLEAVLTYVTVPASNRTFLLPNNQNFTREGLQVINPRLRMTSLFGISGLWAEGEYAYEFSNQQSMSAHGGYVWIGYTAEDLSWRPSIKYRFAGFSGDDPETTTYERFDPLQASGLTDWLQGVNLGKVFNNSNGFSHRLTLGARPSRNYEISLDYYYRFADELNNLGGNRALQTLKSTDLGHEFVLINRYYLSENFLLQGVGSIAFPGSAIRQAVDHDTSPWTTLQLSTFMFF